MQEPPNGGPDDWFFDERSQRWLRHSGVSHWRRTLDERRRYAATPQAQAEREVFLARYGLRLDGGRISTGGIVAGMEPDATSAPAESGRPQRASERFMALLGKPAPAPMTAEQRADFDARMAAADADLYERIERRRAGNAA